MPEKIGVPKVPGMSGHPYYEGQQPEFCGCYYPDVTRLSDNIEEGRRHCFCIRHGKFSFKLGKDVEPIKEVLEIPSDEWRKAERECISNKA
jgi:hypothetical protein